VEGEGGSKAWLTSVGGRVSEGERKKKSTQSCLFMGRPAPPKKEVLSYPHTPSRGERGKKEGEYQEEEKEREFRPFLCYDPAIGAFFLFFFSLSLGRGASQLTFFFFSLFSSSIRSVP